MVLLYGIPGDGPFEMVADALEEAGTPYLILNPRKFENIDFILYVNESGLAGEITVGSYSYPLSSFTGIYNRAVEFAALPEAKNLSPESDVYRRNTQLFDLLSQWIEIAPCRVLNRNSAMSTNASKPYQLSLISPFFEVPETLITNAIQPVKAFRSQHTEIIYKSASSIRSIVKMVDTADDDTLQNIKYCPTLFQSKLNGDNYRVHVVNTDIFAIKAVSDNVDYRYSHKEGKKTTLIPVTLEKDIVEKCLELARLLNLPLAGIDLFKTEDGRWFCFEVNPSPGFSYFEQHTGQPIAKAIAEYLTSI